MIFKVRKHRSKRHLCALVRYLLSRKDKAKERVLLHESHNALPMLPGESPKDYAKQWTAALWRFTAQARGSKKPPEDYFVHAVMSFFPGNDQHAADQLTADQAVAIAKEAMAEVAPGERQVLFVVHGDTAHLHVHIAFSVVEQGGRIWNPHQDFRLWEAAAARLEATHGLYRVTVGRPGTAPALSKAPTSRELNQVVRTGKPSDRMLLQGLVQAAMAGQPSFPVFWQRLLDAGITPIPTIASTGRVSGIAFQLGEHLPMKGSDLGKGFSWPALSKQLHFAASQHLPLLKPFAPRREEAGGEVQVEVGPEERSLPASPVVLPRLSTFVAKPVGADRLDWVWRNKPKRVAFVESPKVFLARSGHQLVPEAIAERAKARGIKRMGVSGSETFRRRMWFELALRDITVAGYEPTLDDQLRLQWWKNEQTTAGRTDYSAGTGPANGGNGPAAVGDVGCDAPGQGDDQRGVGGSDVSTAPGDDYVGSRESGATRGDARPDARGTPAVAPREERVTEPDGRAESTARRVPTLAEGVVPTGTARPQVRRVGRLGDAALLRQGMQPVEGRGDWQVVNGLLEALGRQQIPWSIDYGHAGQASLGQLTRQGEVTAAWSQLLLLNSLRCNLHLQLDAPQSWLRIVGITAADETWLVEQGMSPAIQFTLDGVREAFVPVDVGRVSSVVMERLVARCQSALEGHVLAHVGEVAIPLPGFDYWQGHRLVPCSQIRVDAELIEMRCSAVVRVVRAELAREGGRLPELHSPLPPLLPEPERKPGGWPPPGNGPAMGQP